MTEDEAINILYRICPDYEEEEIEARNMAVDALNKINEIKFRVNELRIDLPEDYHTADKYDKGVMDTINLIDLILNKEADK